MPGGSIGNIARRLRELLRGPRTLAPLVFASRAPLDFRLAGRALSHAALVGLTAGLVGAAFFAALVWLLISWGWLSLADQNALVWISLLMITFLLSVGVSWSHVRRRVSGQADVDDVDQR